METCFTYIDKEDAFFSSDERKWITRIRKLAEKFPDKVTILKQPEENDGCIYARLPQNWMKIAPKRVGTLTDDQILILRNRLAKANEKRAEILHDEKKKEMSAT